MPVLWSHLSVQRPNRTSVERLTAHFRRSGAYPLSLAIIETVSTSSEQRDAIKSLLPVIQTHASQIKSLSLSLRTSAPDFLSHLNDCQFLQLEALELSIYRCPKDLAEALMSRFQQGSRLSSLAWSRTDNFPSNVSWCGLTRLELVGSHTLNAICKILGQSHDIQQLVLDSIVDCPAVDGAVSLPTLHNLEVNSYVPLGHFFGFLHAPSLRTVSIHYRMNANVTRDWEHFGAFLLRSDCKLRKMALWDARSDDSQLTQLLQLPGLQSLASIDIRQPISDAILRRLTLSRVVNKTDLLPLLKSIILSECNSADGVLRDFVSSRISFSPLDFFEVGLNKDQSEDRAYLRLLRDAGRDVRVYHY
ncbi:hypothetical protein EYR36_001675 [Pleurotus pulmonarius]|nr:hypothetical protein EYR36_008381 [Pleurotus pulmonarius]KAF4579855.1 hypothetical protein EYR36_001675 [Pleurotus pulmonarius]